MTYDHRSRNREEAMMLIAPKFGLVAATVFAVAWAVCSFFVMAIPGGMMGVSGSTLSSLSLSLF